MRMIWLTALETSEPLGLNADHIVAIEQKSAKDSHAVGIHLDTGREFLVIENLSDVRALIQGSEIEHE